MTDRQSAALRRAMLNARTLANILAKPRLHRGDRPTLRMLVARLEARLAEIKP